ncbi:MAG: hypothetical protein AVDCRST_MAG70-1975, partial [uncultured Thermomicrobiales bacterium]
GRRPTCGPRRPRGQPARAAGIPDGRRQRFAGAGNHGGL